MYCGSCMHGNTLAAALRKAGANVVLAPVYTPLRTDERMSASTVWPWAVSTSSSTRRCRFGAWMPAFLRRQLDRPSLVSWVARRGSSTRPEQLGRLAVAMFQGEEGPLQGEIEGLIQWLWAEVRPRHHPSVQRHAGRASPSAPETSRHSHDCHAIRRRHLPGKAPAPYYDQARAELRSRAADLSGLVAMSECYADFMAEYSLPAPREDRRDPTGTELGRVCWGGGRANRRARHRLAVKGLVPSP